MPTASKTARATVAPIFRKQAALRAKKESERQSMLRAAFHKTGAATFVSTSMTVVAKGESHALDEIVYDNGTVHYRLTPLFWAYLHHAFNNATRACEAGKLGAGTYSELLNRISRIYNMALAQYGKAALKSAEQSFTPAKWKRHCESLNERQDIRDIPNCPTEPRHCESIYRYPPDADGAIASVSPSSKAKVDAIRERALHAGWTLSQLYRNVGIAHRDWGLVCYIGFADKIGEATRQSIEIIDQRTGKSLRFYNREVDQPWIKTNPKGGNA